jgi:signal transduction histidine kinase
VRGKRWWWWCGNGGGGGGVVENKDLSEDLSVDEKYMVINIVDTGCGMSENFIRTRLFKPFDTTKGNAGMGIGAFDAKTYLERNGGHLLVHSQKQQGTTFTLRIPTN